MLPSGGGQVAVSESRPGFCGVSGRLRASRWRGGCGFGGAGVWRLRILTDRSQICATGCGMLGLRGCSGNRGGRGLGFGLRASQGMAPRHLLAGGGGEGVAGRAGGGFAIFCQKGVGGMFPEFGLDAAHAAEAFATSASTLKRWSDRRACDVRGIRRRDRRGLRRIRRT
jgi:hypothetical protein